MKKARSSSDEGQSSFILNKKPIPDVTLIVHEKSLDKNLLVRIVQECCTPYFYHKFIIGNIGTYSKKYILKVISNFVYPASFRALHYTVIKNKAVFLSRNCQELLLKICSENFRITNPEFPDNPFEVIILANFILYEEVQMEDDSQSILDVLKKRFKNETETIDLSEFSEDEGLTDYYPLFQMKFMLAVTSTIAEFSPKHLNLQNNCIRDISNLYPLKDFIESIDLCNNMIEDMSALMPLINFKTLKNLSLSGNPFCEKYNNYNYVLDVKRYCQNLEKLDGFDVTIPVFQKNLFCTSDAIDLVKNFIEHFFTVYDSNNRGNLIDLYDKNALFSVTAKIVPNQKNSSSAQLDHYGLKIPYVMCGATEIMKLFKTFPKTYHDPYPPVCDVTLFTDTHVSLVIGGVLKELQQILSFTRHFVFKRSDDRYVITNDQYHVSNALDFQTGWSFGFPMHLAISGNPLPYFQEEYRELEEVVHKITNMNYEYSQKYLDYCQYDLKKTLHLFSQLHVRGDVPENAFTPKSATPQQFQQGVLPYSEKMRKLVYKKHKSINLKTIWETLHCERMRALPGKPRTTDPTIKKIYRNVIIPSIDDNPKAPVDSYIPAPKKANHKPVSFNIQVPIINNEKPVQMVKPATKAVADPLVELAEKLAKHKELAAKKANELRQSLVSGSGPSPVNRAAAAVPSMVPPPNQSPNPNVGVNSTAANFTPGSILGPGPSFTSAMGNPFLPGQPLLGDPGMIHHGLQPHLGPSQFQMHAQQRFPMQHQFPVSFGNLQSAPRPLFPIPQGEYQSVIEVSKVTVGTVAKPAGNAVGSNTAPAVARPRGATPSLTGVALMPRGLGVGSQFGQLRAPVSVPNAAGSNLSPSGLSTRIESGGKNNTSGRIPLQNSHEGCKNPRRGRSKDARRSRSKSRSRSSSISRSRKKRSSSRNRNRRSRDMSNRSRSRGIDCSKRSRSRSKDRSKRSRSRSKNRRTKRSRSRSKDRKKRSRSRSKDKKKRSRSRSKDRKKRSRSRSKDKKKRSRSRSKDRTKRSRSRSKDGSTRSRSRSKDGPQRSRSRSKDRPNRSRSYSKYGPQRSRSRSKDGPKCSRSRSKDKVEPSKSDGSSPSKTTSNKNVISRIIRRTDAEKGSPRSENEEGGSEIDSNATSTSYPSTSGKKKIKIAYRYRLDKIFPRKTTNDTSSLVIERSPSGAVVSVSTAKNVTTGSGPSISNIRTDEEYVLSLAERKRRLDIKIQLGLRKLSALRQSASNENEKNESANEVCSANNDAFCVKEGAAKQDTANKIADESSLDISHEKHIADVEESLAVIQKNSESTDETIETEKNTPPEIGLEESEVNLKLGKMESISIGHMVEAELFKTLSKNDSEGLVVSLMKISSTDNKNVETSSDNVQTSKSEYMTVGVTLDDNKNAEETSSDNVKTPKSDVLGVGVYIDDNENAEINTGNVTHQKSEVLSVEVSHDGTKKAETISDTLKTPKSEVVSVKVSLDNTKNAETISDNLKTLKSEGVSVGVTLGDTQNAETISDNLKTPKYEVLAVPLDGTKNAETISDNVKTIEEDLKPSHAGGVTVEVSADLKIPKSEGYEVGTKEMDSTENMKSTPKMVILSTTPVSDNISEKSSNMKDHLITSSNSDKHGKSDSRGEKGFSVNKYIEKSISSKTINQTDEQTTFGELDMTEKNEKEVCQSANISSNENLVHTPNFAEVKVQIPTSVEPFEEINKEKILTESHAVNETIKPASDVSSSVIITVNKSGTYEIPETPSERYTAVDSVDNNIANIDADKLKRAGEDESAIKASPINCSQKAIEGNVDTSKLTVEVQKTLTAVVQPCNQERDGDIEDNNLDRTPDLKERLNTNILSEKISENTTTNSTDVGGKKSEDERTTKNLTDVMFLDVCTRKKSVDESTYAIDKIVQLADGMIDPETSSASTTKLVSTDGNEFDNSEKQNETIIGTNKQVAEIMKTLAESNGKHVENAENEEKEISDGSHNVGKAKTDPIDPDRSVDENKKLAADYSRKLIVQLRNVAIEIDSTIKKKLPTEKSATIREVHQPEEPKQMKIHLDEISIAKKLKTNKHLTINLVRMSVGVKFNHEEIEEETGGNEIKKKMQSEIERRIPNKRRPVKTLEMNSSSYRKKYLAEIDTKPQSRESSEEPILIVEDIPLVQVESSDEETQIKQAFQRTDEKLHNLAISNIFSLADEVPSTSHNTEVVGLDKQAPSSSHEMNDENVTKDTDSIMRKESPILLTISSDEEDTSHEKICFSVDDSDDVEPEYVSLEDILGAK